MDAFTTLTYDTDGGVAVVTFAHPPVNLLDAAMILELAQVEALLREDRDVRVAVVRSADDEFFVAHADLQMIRDLPREPVPAPTELGFFHTLLERWRTLPQLTIAEIDGFARGGGSEFALSLDLRFGCVEHATLGQPEVAIGIIPGGGGTQRLARFAGRARALEIVLGAEDFDATTAATYGWINRALAHDALRPFVDELARRVAAHPADAVRLAKETVDAAAPPFTDGLLAEQAAFDRTLADPDLDARFDAALDAGAQTRAGERDLVRRLGPTKNEHR